MNLKNGAKNFCRRQQKTFPFSATKSDVEKRIVRGYASTWDRDTIDDRVLPGAFTKTINERGPRTIDIATTNDAGETTTESTVRSRIKVGYNHQDVIGLPLRMEEDEKGLYTEYRVDPTNLGNEVLIKINSGTLDVMSFAYDIIDLEYDENTGDRLLKELKVYEFGPVDYACNEAADILGLKALQNLKRLQSLGYSSIDLSGAFEELKAGRVLSRINREKVESAVEVLTTLLLNTEPETQDEAESVDDHLKRMGLTLASLRTEYKAGDFQLQLLAGPLMDMNQALKSTLAQRKGE